MKQHDDPARYREVVGFIKNDPRSVGALVTTHKIDLLHAARDLFDELDDFGSLMGEVSAISKRDGLLCGGAKDPITSGLALEAFLPPRALGAERGGGVHHGRGRRKRGALPTWVGRTTGGTDPRGSSCPIAVRSG